MKKLLIVVVLLWMQIACSQSNNTFEKEAEAICAIYTPESLAATTGMDLLARFEYVNSKIRNTIKSQTFNTIFDELAQEGNTDFYGALQAKVSTHLGKVWTCDDAKAFYAISWQRVDPQQDAKVVQVYIVDGAFYEIDGKHYAFSDIEKLQSAINTVTNGEEFKLHLNVPNATSSEELNVYLGPLRKIGIKNLSIVEVN